MVEAMKERKLSAKQESLLDLIEQNQGLSTYALAQMINQGFLRLDQCSFLSDLRSELFLLQYRGWLWAEEIFRSDGRLKMRRWWRV